MFLNSEDLWLFDLDWSTKELKLLKGHEKEQKISAKKAAKTVVSSKSFSSVCLSDNLNENVFFKIASQKERNQINDLLDCLNQNELTNKISNTTKWLPKNLQHLYNYPK